MPNWAGLPEILLIVGVIVLLFGAKKLPEVARSMGKARSEFKKGVEEGEAKAAKETQDAEAPPSKT